MATVEQVRTPDEFYKGMRPIPGFDAAQEIEKLRDHLALIAVQTGTNSRDLLCRIAAMYSGLEHCDRRKPRR